VSAMRPQLESCFGPSLYGLLVPMNRGQRSDGAFLTGAFRLLRYACGAVNRGR
jgi:hypothetical protein